MSVYTLILAWWSSKDHKLHEKRWNRDDLFKALQFKDKLIAAKATVVAQFAVVEESGEYGGAW